MNPLARLSAPADMAAAVAFLVGPDDGWLTRQRQDDLTPKQL